MSASRTVVLLRGVNVGGHNKIAMADFAALLTDLGYTAVRTVLQSGNAVVEAGRAQPARVAADVEAALRTRSGLDVRVMARRGAEIAEVLAANPLAAPEDPSRFLVTFLDRAPAPDRLDGLDAAAYEPDRFAVVDRHVYQWCPAGINATKLTYAFWERRLGVAATARNWRTVVRLAELAAD